MKLLEINSVNYGSTGKIMYSLADIMIDNGHSVLCATGFTWNKSNHRSGVLIGSLFSKTIHMVLSSIFGKHGCYSKRATKKLIDIINDFSPDIIHLHNIHGWYLNIQLLFQHIKTKSIPVIWTLHDCWAFTGGCAHFTYVKCDKWKMSCSNCKNLSEYPIKSRKDKTHDMFDLKKSLFKEVKNMTIVTPSQWLANLVKQSFLREYPVRVINNGINLEIFKPTPSKLRYKYGLIGKKIILGVSFGWGNRKGLDVFIELSKIFSNDYQIVLVGTDENTDKLIPDNIISIHRTNSQQELAEFYTAADVFVNPTREENYPTVNMEALACGTPVVTFRTGGSPEILDETCGAVVDYNDLDSLSKEIKRICEINPYSEDACVNRAKNFDMHMRFIEYINLYEEMLRE